MRIVGSIIVNVIALASGGCSGSEPANTITGDRTTQVQVHNDLAPAGDGPDFLANGQVNMTDPTAGEEVEPALDNSSVMNTSGR